MELLGITLLTLHHHRERRHLNLCPNGHRACPNMLVRRRQYYLQTRYNYCTCALLFGNICPRVFRHFISRVFNAYMRLRSQQLSIVNVCQIHLRQSICIYKSILTLPTESGPPGPCRTLIMRQLKVHKELYLLSLSTYRRVGLNSFVSEDEPQSSDSESFPPGAVRTRLNFPE